MATFSDIESLRTSVSCDFPPPFSISFLLLLLLHLLLFDLFLFFHLYHFPLGSVFSENMLHESLWGSIHLVKLLHYRPLLLRYETAPKRGLEQLMLLLFMADVSALLDLGRFVLYYVLRKKKEKCKERMC